MTLTAQELEDLADDLVESHDLLLEKLVSMRKKHNLSQDQVAERMGVSQPTVSAFERYDANPTLGTIRRYALAVGASIQHEIKDACHAKEITVEAVRAVVAPSTWWEPKPDATWAWPSGPATAKAFVNA